MMELLERQMLLMKLMLVLMRDRRAKQGQVRSVGYIREYGEMPEEMGVYTLGEQTDEQLIALSEQIGVKKRLAAGKSDIYMNDMGYALVWTQAPVVFIAETEVKELAKLAQQLELTEMVEAAVTWHQEQVYREELVVISKANDEAAPYAKRNESWQKLIAHWWCKGDAKEPSRFPADYVLQYEDALNMNSWDIYEPQRYVELMWDRIEFHYDPAADKLSVIAGAAGA